MSRTPQTAANVTVIPALTPEELIQRSHKQIKVAAYCRVSTDVLHSYD